MFVLIFALQVTGVSIINGFALALPPLAGQAFGAKNYLRCGQLLERTVAIHACAVLPVVAALWLSAEQVLVAAGQPRAIAKLAGEFLRWRLIGLPCYAIWEDLVCFLRAQQVVAQPMMQVHLAVRTLSLEETSFVSETLFQRL